MTSITIMTSAFVGPGADDVKLPKLKLAVLGDKQVGKSSLLTRYTKGTFNPIYLHTKGGDMSEKKVTVNGLSLHVSIIDSAGHYYVRSIIKSLYRNVHGILLVYDVTREKTFDSLSEWLRQIKTINTSEPFIVLVGNKNDLEGHKTVPFERASQFAYQHGLNHYEVSAKTGVHVGEAFRKLIEGTYSDKIPGNYVVDSIRLNKAREDEKDDSPCCGS